MGSGYYDRQGMPIKDVLELARLMEDRDYAVVRQTRHKERGREFWLSTVWLGIDHSFGNSVNSEPLIFETMALEYKPAWNEIVATKTDWFWQERYATEDEAVAARDPWRVVTTHRPEMLKLLLDAVFGPPAG